MPRSRAIWIDAEGGSARGFGCDIGDEITLKVRVGSSGAHSKKISVIKITSKEDGESREFSIIIDGMVYRKQEFNNATKEFKELKGFQIDGKSR